MNSRFKMVPVGILTHLLHCGDTATTITPYLTARLRELLEAPVPPAGDVEVLGFAARQIESGRVYDIRPNYNPFTSDYLEWTSSEKSKIRIVELVDRAHVTRLTAERDAAIKAATLGAENLNKALETCDALREELDKYRRGFWGRMAARTQIALRKSESELTKARELLMRLRNCKWIPTAEWQHEVSEVLAHQSAPAAKCSICNGTGVVGDASIGYDHCFHNVAPAAKGGE